MLETRVGDGDAAIKRLSEQLATQKTREALPAVSVQQWGDLSDRVMSLQRFQTELRGEARAQEARLQSEVRSSILGAQTAAEAQTAAAAAGVERAQQQLRALDSRVATLEMERDNMSTLSFSERRPSVSQPGAPPSRRGVPAALDGESKDSVSVGAVASDPRVPELQTALAGLVEHMRRHEEKGGELEKRLDSDEATLARLEQAMGVLRGQVNTVQTQTDAMVTATAQQKRGIEAAEQGARTAAEVRESLRELREHSEAELASHASALEAHRAELVAAHGELRLELRGSMAELKAAHNQLAALNEQRRLARHTAGQKGRGSC